MAANTVVRSMNSQALLQSVALTDVSIVLLKRAYVVLNLAAQAPYNIDSFV